MSDKVEILFILGSNSECNSAYHLVNVACRLQDMGYTVAVEFGELSSGISQETLLIHGVAITSNTARSVECEVLYLWNPRRYEIQRYKEIKYNNLIIHLEDNEIELAKRFGGSSAVEKLLEVLRASDAVTGVNENVSELLTESSKVCSIMPGIDDLTIPSENEELVTGKYSSNYVLYAGNVTEFVLEGLINIGEALEEVNQSFGESKYLVVTGKDWTNQLRERLTGNVVICNFLSKKLAAQFVRSAWALVQPASYEAFDRYRFPSKLAEYFVSGVPVITNPFAIRIPLISGINCFVSEKNSVSSWKEAFVARLISSPQRINLITENAKDIAKEYMNWDASVENLRNRVIDNFLAVTLERTRN